MKTERALVEAIQNGMAEYHEAVEADKPESVLRPMSDAIIQNKKKLSAVLSKGAKECEKCGNPVIGMKVRPGVYEVGCLNCPGGSRGETAEEAIENWNNGEMIRGVVAPAKSK